MAHVVELQIAARDQTAAAFKALERELDSAHDEAFKFNDAWEKLGTKAPAALKALERQLKTSERAMNAAHGEALQILRKSRKSRSMGSKCT